MDNYSKIIRFTIIIGLVFLASVPFLPVSQPMYFYMMFWVIMASAFNIIYGFVGYLPFGYVMFYGVGTYVTAILWSKFHVPIPVGIMVSGITGILLALFFTPTLRLKGIYFAIVNFASAMALRILVSNMPEAWTGGSFGITLTGAFNPMAAYYTMLVLMLVTIVVSLWLSQSKLGIALRCIRDDESAAKVMGINVQSHRLKAWCLAALFPSLAGGVEAWFSAIVDPDTSFNMLFTAKTIVYTMFGGLGTITGPIFGSIFMYELDDIIWAHFPLMNLMVLGFAIIFLILFLPKGVVGSIINKRPNLRKIIR